MSSNQKDEKAILAKLGISELNAMQLKANETISTQAEVVLLSPTGTGKTLAFLLPLIKLIDPTLDHIQLLIIVPSRELAIQIQQVLQEMGSGFKSAVVYGGRSGSKDRSELKHPSHILVGTAGRVADHIRNEVIETENIHTLVLDEFDKSLEVGFEEEMEEIIYGLPSLTKKVLTSATQKSKIPSFVGLENPIELNFLKQSKPSIDFKVVETDKEDTLETLLHLLRHIGNKNGIVFCNFKSTIPEVSAFLRRHKIDHATFHGDLEQRDRARALIKFRNGTHRLLIATDLAARGIDVPALDFIIHYELPPRPDEFVHRNGRTGRMNNNGTAYILKWKERELPVFIKASEVIQLKASKERISKDWVTLYITGGKRDKISKGDVAGLFFKKGALKKGELGIIEIHPDCAYVSVPPSKAKVLIHSLNNERLKKKKVRISLLE